MSVEAVIFRDADRAPRVRLDTEATLRDDAGYPVELTLIDLSQSGFLIRTAVELDIGEQFSIGIPGVAAHRAVVRRRDGDEYGCEFFQPLTEQEVSQAGLDTVIAWPGTDTADFAAHPPVTQRYPRRVRALIYGAGLVLSWAAVFGISRLIL
ncbi:PilZ domain-containing protein [Stakelama sp. CBK3Z-3]|uniref:PilZ domain-containing protein n=1 Tax=Stakelama flava TaxID=2860338 RepID=A0ABS6XLW1_9SPHN|nr:PilZ domain-containing protein [Stakelama flava]MBW4331207.1 PilZ domain-containing protein [Stakelama flava]